MLKEDRPPIASTGDAENKYVGKRVEGLGVGVKLGLGEGGFVSPTFEGRGVGDRVGLYEKDGDTVGTNVGNFVGAETPMRLNL